ncbi:MAG: type II toxin-antitoxin system RelE/ParE family toxin [Sphingobacteriaceae bacterium]|nr:MAG: type II toxin-antitoxin system RelE/ParE family toxin [Sphingobacteriaceae bacterium]
MFYKINFSKLAFKELAKIPEPYYSNIKQVIYNLPENPRPQGYKSLKGRTGFRIRVGNYRIIYDIIDTVLVVNVITIGHRKDVYQ